MAPVIMHFCCIFWPGDALCFRSCSATGNAAGKRRAPNGSVVKIWCEQARTWPQCRGYVPAAMSRQASWTDHGNKLVFFFVKRLTHFKIHTRELDQFKPQITVYHIAGETNNFI
jgi:hypothetical protein